MRKDKKVNFRTIVIGTCAFLAGIFFELLVGYASVYLQNVSTMVHPSPPRTIETEASRKGENFISLNLSNPLLTPFHTYVSQYKECRTCPKLDKWEPYFEAYHRHFSKFRGKQVTFVEVGIQSGGSALMWRWYFGEHFRYIGIDINPNAKKFESSWAKIIIGDQASVKFWDEFKVRFPDKVDIILDDGGHTMLQQKQTLRSMYSHVKPGGIYACEDLATSYLKKFGGNSNFRLSPAKSGTMVGMTKDFVDYVNGNYLDIKELPPFARQIAHSLKSAHYYNQIVIMEKIQDEKRKNPQRITFGKSIPYRSKPPWDPPAPLSLATLEDFNNKKT